MLKTHNKQLLHVHSSNILSARLKCCAVVFMNFVNKYKFDFLLYPYLRALRDPSTTKAAVAGGGPGWQAGAQPFVYLWYRENSMSAQI